MSSPTPERQADDDARKKEEPKCVFCGEVTPTCPSPTCTRCLDLEMMNIRVCLTNVLEHVSREKCLKTSYSLAEEMTKAIAKFARGVTKQGWENLEE